MRTMNQKHKKFKFVIYEFSVSSATGGTLVINSLSHLPDALCKFRVFERRGKDHEKFISKSVFFPREG